jgi:hypothetical protein
VGKATVWATPCRRARRALPDACQGSGVTHLRGSGKMEGPTFGNAPLNPIQRCTICNRRLKLKAIFCVGGEFLYWKVPQHKARTSRRPAARRQSRFNGRGK